jgi:hypothetical protein
MSGRRPFLTGVTSLLQRDAEAATGRKLAEEVEVELPARKPGTVLNP